MLKIILPLMFLAVRKLFSDGQPESMPLRPRPWPSEAEIDAKLAAIAKERGKGYDKNSIVDTLDVLGIRNDSHTRGALYADLGGEGEYSGTSDQNTWMIQQVRRRFAEGQID